MGKFSKILNEMSGDIDKQLASTAILPMLSSSKVIFNINGIDFEIKPDSENIKRFIQGHKSLNINTDTKGLIKISLRTV